MKNLLKKTIRVILLSLAGYYLVFIYLLPSFELQFNEEVILPFYGTFSSNKKNHGHTVRILSRSGACSAVIIDDNYALTAAHCVVDSFQRLDPDLKFSIYDEFGNDTFTIAKPVAAELSRDIALLKGKFLDFEYASVDYMGQDRIKVGDSLLSCGFPSAQPFMYCADWKLSGSYNFRHTATGTVIQKGCSGGPVFDEYGNVIGVNSAVYDDKFLIAPVVGVFDEFGIQAR